MNPTYTPAPVAFLKSGNFLRTWTEQQGEVCQIQSACLSVAKPAPPVAYAPVKPAPPPAARKTNLTKLTEADRMLNVVEAGFKVAGQVSAFSAWLKSPPPPPKVTPKAAPAPAVKKVPPFDIQEVPNAMRKVGMPMAAKLQERWFAGAANYSRTEKDLRDEIDQNGQRYVPAMVDRTTITLDWVLSFSRAKQAFDELIKEQLQTRDALKALGAILVPHRHLQDISTGSVASADLLEFHQKFQFQRISVNASWGSRIAEHLDRSLRARGVPDDLTASLGAFNFYAAVRYARFTDLHRYAEVEHVSVYVRDPYAFTDEQYLGHWNASHVAVVPAHAAAGGWLNYPVVQGSAYDKGNVLYPVTNKDYRDWRTQHGQGGDFIIYTEPVSVRLETPIRVQLA